MDATCDVWVADIPREDHLLALQAGVTFNNGLNPVAQGKRSGDEAGGDSPTTNELGGLSPAEYRPGGRGRSAEEGQQEGGSSSIRRLRCGAAVASRRPRGRSALESLHTGVREGGERGGRVRVQATARTARLSSALGAPASDRVNLAAENGVRNAEGGGAAAHGSRREAVEGGVQTRGMARHCNKVQHLRSEVEQRSIIGYFSKNQFLIGTAVSSQKRKLVMMDSSEDSNSNKCEGKRSRLVNGSGLSGVSGCTSGRDSGRAAEEAAGSVPGQRGRRKRDRNEQMAREERGRTRARSQRPPEEEAGRGGDQRRARGNTGTASGGARAQPGVVPIVRDPARGQIGVQRGAAGAGTATSTTALVAQAPGRTTGEKKKRGKATGRRRGRGRGRVAPRAVLVEDEASEQGSNNGRAGGGSLGDRVGVG